MENNMFSMNKKLNKLESNKVIINDNHDVEIESLRRWAIIDI